MFERKYFDQDFVANEELSERNGGWTRDELNQGEREKRRYLEGFWGTGKDEARRIRLALAYRGVAPIWPKVFEPEYGNGDGAWILWTNRGSVECQVRSGMEARA